MSWPLPHQPQTTARLHPPPHANIIPFPPACRSPPRSAGRWARPHHPPAARTLAARSAAAGPPPPASLAKKQKTKHFFAQIELSGFSNSRRRSYAWPATTAQLASGAARLMPGIAFGHAYAAQRPRGSSRAAAHWPGSGARLAAIPPACSSARLH